MKYNGIKAISFNGGKESLIILYKYMKETDIVFNVEDNNDFPEIVEYVSYMCNYFKIRLLTFKDMKESINILKEKYGVNMIILGCRRTDPNCKELNVITPTDSGWPHILRFNPLLDWTYSDVWNYITDNKLPICPLYEKGYTSIGNRLNTFPNYSLFDGDKFLHAKYLAESSTERDGRIRSKLPISFSGKVIKGKGLGKKLGFATANLDASIFIDEGVYYGYSSFSPSTNGEKYKMVMSCGTNPQFGDKTVEIHILNNFEADFYDQILQIDIIGFIRKMKKYNYLEDLISDINKDISICNYYLEF